MTGAMTVPVLRTVNELRKQVRAWRQAGETIALVPTMGALHRGHLALIAEGQRHATKTIASIFVNPAQFAPTEDFAAYPRTLESDLAKLAQACADACFVPDVAAMYPVGFATTVTLAGPATVDLEDRFRPTHFAGVATVVAKLLNQATPDAAIFGEKDYQQLMVVRAMARDLDIDTAIVGLATVREDDGLALSSRNVYLSASERARAPLIYRVLNACCSQAKDRSSLSEAVLRAKDELTAAGFVLDYLEARSADTLAPLNADGDEPVRLLIAARLGRTRLIDNISVA